MKPSYLPNNIRNKCKIILKLPIKTWRTSTKTKMRTPMDQWPKWAINSRSIKRFWCSPSNSMKRKRKCNRMRSKEIRCGIMNKHMLERRTQDLQEQDRILASQRIKGSEFRCRLILRMSPIKIKWLIKVSKVLKTWSTAWRTIRRSAKRSQVASTHSTHSQVNLVWNHIRKDFRSMKDRRGWRMSNLAEGGSTASTTSLISERIWLFNNSCINRKLDMVLRSVRGHPPPCSSSRKPPHN